MKNKRVFAAASVALIVMLLTACSAPKPTPTPTLPAGPPPTTGIQYYFVTNKLLIPATQTQKQEFALNLDGDSQQRTDNLFGELLTLLTSAAPGLEIQANLDQAVNAGQLVTLHVLKADDLASDSSVSWTIFHGQKTLSAPTFDGSDKFTLDAAAPANPPIIGTLTNGHFTGGPGTARVQMYLMGTAIEVNLIGVLLETDVSAQGCVNGKLGGGITVDEFRAKLLPTIADGLNRILKMDQAVTNPLLQTFDSDHDGTITVQELEKNPVLMLAVSPDLDLVDGSGAFNPGQDGAKDSYSVGLGFTCVPAVFSTGVVSAP